MSKGKNILEMAAKHAAAPKAESPEHEAAEPQSFEQGEQEGLQEADNQLCPACHSKIQAHLQKLREAKGQH